MTLLDEQKSIHHPRGLEVCIDCGEHEDAPIHHTPERLAGKTGPAVGWRMTTNPFEQGSMLLAAKLTPRMMGYGHIRGLCQDALEDLVAAGWTPPAEGGGDEAARLRAEVARTRQQLEDMQQQLGRLAVEEEAAQEFRFALFGAGREVAEKRRAVAMEQLDEFNVAMAEVKYSRLDVEEFLRKALDVCDGVVAKHRRMLDRQRAQFEKGREAVQDALFDMGGA